MAGGNWRCVLAGDLHVPFHDPVAVRLWLKFIRRWRPDAVVLTGDVLDCYQLSRFDRDPARRERLADDIQAANALLDAVDRAAGDVEKVYVAGNHEDRLRRYLWRSAPELAGLPGLTVPELLRLERRGWRYVDYLPTDGGEPGYRLAGLLVIHGWTVRQGAGQTARACLQRFGGDGVTGHCHRLAHYQQRQSGVVHQWYEAGCLCRLTPQYNPLPDWQHGFLAGQQLADGTVWLDTVPLRDRRLWWQGMVWG